MVEAINKLHRSLASAKAAKLSAETKLESIRAKASESEDGQTVNQLEAAVKRADDHIYELEMMIEIHTGQPLARQKTES